MNAKTNIALLAVLTIILASPVSLADTVRTNRSRVSYSNGSGFSITISGGTRHSDNRRSHNNYRVPPYRHRTHVITTYPKRFPLGPVIVYSPSKTPIEMQQKLIIVITNDNGSQSPIELIKLDGYGYKGPKGEFYSELPTEGQLRALYGLSTEICTISDLQEAASVVTVWIENENGSRTPVELTKQGRSYVGPQGEYYSTMPTEQQLKAMYGLNSYSVPEESVTVVINNTDGSTTQVVLVKDGTNYIGPNGEYYAGIPTSKQLVPVYGS